MESPSTDETQIKPAWGRRWYDTESQPKSFQKDYPDLAAYTQACRAQAMINRPSREQYRLASCMAAEPEKCSSECTETDKTRRTVACIRRDVLLDRWFRADDRIRAQYSNLTQSILADHGTSGAYEQFMKTSVEGPEVIDQLTRGSKLNVTVCWRAWKKRWVLEGHAERLRALYGNDKAKYRKAFWQQDDIVTAVQENAMAAFVRVITSLERQVQQAPYMRADRSAMEAFASTLISPAQPSEAEADVVFVSIDLEGRHYKASGLTDCGIAKLDTRHFATSGGLESSGIALNCTIPYLRYNQPTLDFIAKAVQQGIPTLDHSGHMRKVVLIGHGLLSSDLALLQQHLGIGLDECGVVGYIDTCKLAVELLGHKGNLQSLLELLRIPHKKYELHCAGNDAYYTMVVLLAMTKRGCLQSPSDEASDGLKRLDCLLSTVMPGIELNEAVMENETDGHDLGDTFM